MKKQKGYVLIQSIIVLLIIFLISGMLIKISTLKLQDSYYYSKSNNVKEFTDMEESLVIEIEEKLNSDKVIRDDFVKKLKDKESELYKFNKDSSEVSILYKKDKIYLSEKTSARIHEKEIVINVDSDNIMIGPGIYRSK